MRLTQDSKLQIKDLGINYYNIDDNEIVQSYLEERKKRSINSYYASHSIILNCLNFINKPLILITKTDMIEYFNYLNASAMKFSSKNEYRGKLRTFFNYCEYYFEENNIDFRNPVPKLIRFEFEKTNIDYNVSYEEEVFTDDELIRILEDCKKMNLRNFILLALLIFCGMRVSEVLSIFKTNVNLEKGYIITGIVKNAKKQNKSLIFFFPKEFTPYLKHYISKINKIDNSIWLVPSREKKNNPDHLKPDTFRKFLHKYLGEKYAKTHFYRKTLITNRILRMNCPDAISELLTNHKINTTQWRYYIKLSLEKRRELYDKFFPYAHFPFLS